MYMLPIEHCSVIIVIILCHRQMAGERIVVHLVFYSDF
jgi:hypothetical protein